MFGGTWKIPIAEGSQDPSVIENVKLSDTYSPESFDREYNSKWYGDAEDAFFSNEIIKEARQLYIPHLKYQLRPRADKDCFYVIGVDVGRTHCTTEITVVLVRPRNDYSMTSIKEVVNIITVPETDFEQQAKIIKKAFFNYNARAVAIDANGLGIGLIDFMTKAQKDPQTGTVLKGFGVCDSLPTSVADQYKDKKGEDFIEGAMFLCKFNAQLNSDHYAYMQSQFSNHKLKLLVGEKDAKENLLRTKEGRAMTLSDRNDYLQPFVQTTSLESQLLNLKREMDSKAVTITLKQSSTLVLKDKFSSLLYALAYIKTWEDGRTTHKKKINVEDLLLFGQLS